MEKLTIFKWESYMYLELFIKQKKILALDKWKPDRNKITYFNKRNMFPLYVYSEYIFWC